MGSSSVFYAIGNLLTWTFGIFEMIGNSFNYALIVLGFIGLFYWLNMQKKLSDKAKREGTLK
jgi:hypothetical protein